MLGSSYFRGLLKAFTLLLPLAAASSMAGCGSDDDEGSSTTLGRACQANGDCPGGEPFCSGGRCVECLDDANCGEPGTQCDGVSGECLQSCTSTAECDGERVCAVERNACVECVDDNDCTDSGKPYCIPELDDCKECRSSADCGGAPCDNGSCRECDSHDDCAADEPFCDVAEYKCRECLQNDHCAPGEICDGDECRATCVADPGLCGADEVCDPQSGVCVSCLTDADCGADKPGCVDFECRECSQDEHCDAGKVCNTSDGKCE